MAEGTAPAPGADDHAVIDVRENGAGPPDEALGICCSGGGIRSAAFNLGALQVLDRAGVLARSRYLSAVSGGSYIASAYAVATRHSDPDLLEAQPAYAPGSPEERWLRNRCSYLADGVAGKARLVASVLVGVLANVVFFGLVLFTAMRPLGWLYARWQETLQVPAGCGSTRRRGCFRTAHLEHAGPWLLAVGVTVAAAIVVALVVRMFYPGWKRRQALNRVAVGLLVGAGVVALVSLVLPGLVVLTRNLLGSRDAVQPVAMGAETSAQVKSGNSLAVGSTVGFLAVVATAATQLAVQLRGVFSVGKKVAAGARWYTKLNQGLRRLLVYLVGGLVGPLALLAGALVIVNDAATRRSPTGAEVALWAAVAVVTLVVLLYADITSWSMHPFYKRRLSSAFAVARGKDRGGRPEAREVDYATVLAMSEFARDRMPRPFPEILVCAAANVSDPGATPPGSDVVSFVFGPTTISMAAGDGTTTTMATPEYERRVGERRRLDVTLPAAVAMSGAAISPSMGKMTIAPLRFLLALANVRLGVWMPNPRHLPVGCDRPDGTSPALVDRVAPANPRPHLLAREILGLHRLSSRYVYVTDGGHYENLGLLELVRRRCTTVVCLDAAGGSPTSFSTLGQAIALVRAELNVEIEVDPTVIRPSKGAGLAARCVAVGSIRYPDGLVGRLIYVKSAVVAASPWDVLAFAEKDKVFPSHPTASQLYTGERFEAYRALGAAAGEQAVAALGPPLAEPRPTAPEPATAT